MKLDTFTMLTALAVLSFSLSLAILALWRYLSSKKHLLIWGIGMGCYSAGLLLIVLREHIPLILSATVSNVLLMSYYGMTWWGVSLHRGRKPHLNIIMVSIAIGTALHYWFTFNNPDLVIRIIILRIYIVAILAAAIKTLLDTDKHILTRMEKVLCAALFMEITFRSAILVAQFSFFNYQAPLQKNMITTIGAALTIISLIAWVVAIILETLEKTVAERTAAEAESSRVKKHLETTFHAMTDMVCLLDLNGKIIIHNRAMEKFLGLTENKINGHHCYELMHGADKHIVNCPFERMMQSKQRENLLLELNDRWLEVSVDPVLDDNRQIIAAVHLVKDVTEHKKLVSELERQLSILEATHNELYIFDINDWHFTYVNGSALKNLGYTPVEIVKLTPLDLKPAINRDSFEHLIAPLLSGEKLLVHFETSHRRKDGSEYPVEVYLQTVEERSGSKHFLAVIHDITERINTLELLKQKNAETEQFIYTVSHDLRSPLVTIRTFLGYLRDDLQNAEQAAEDLQFIQGAADKMEEMLQELLELSRLGFKESRISATSSRELAEEAVATLAGQTAEKGITVRITGSDIPLRGDRQRLSQIWQNLLENAIKYMSDNDNPAVTIGVEMMDDETVFFVRDNGIGIAPENMDRVFSIFEKLGQRSSGVGMGLTIVKRIVELNKGRIWVESPGPGQGSCFHFTLPEAVTAARICEEAERVSSGS